MTIHEELKAVLIRLITGYYPSWVPDSELTAMGLLRKKPYETH